ncbi:hypothetical protein N0V91_005014 [Didymella pomorum]|uniref:Uncharacterized protein n=1 Tax=Didymella pomorum TaxID=749634 RepID=A0A9W9D7Q9_9PLEO|nr:hypothetical protein N0V91_005014 [Didymella pomorum]
MLAARWLSHTFVITSVVDFVSHSQNTHIASSPPGISPNMPAPRELGTPSMQMMKPIPSPPGPQGPPGASDDFGESLGQQNIAFLRHHCSVYGKRIKPNDISVVIKN